MESWKISGFKGQKNKNTADKKHNMYVDLKTNEDGDYNDTYSGFSVIL